MNAVASQRFRKARIGVAFAIAVFATAATSPASVSIAVPPTRGSFRLDAGHPGALTRITVRINAEANAATYTDGVKLALDAVRVAGASDKPYGARDSAHFILTTVPPRAGAAAGTSVPSSPDPAPSAVQVEVRPGLEATLPMDCGIGPCERAFWLVAELSEPYVQPIEVDWQVRGAIIYSSTTWPSGAGVTVDADPSIVLAAPLPQLVASTETETLVLGPERPAAARVVEVRIGAAAIPSDGSPVGALSVDVVPRSGPAVAVYALGQPAGDGGAIDVPQRPAVSNGMDPFADCVPGAPCTRRFLVTIAWTGDAGEESLDWKLTVRRVDLLRAWSTPAEVSATVARRIDIDPGSKSAVAHLEGEVAPGLFDSPEQERLLFSTVTTSKDPIAGFLPVPAVMTFRAEVAAASLPLPSGSTGPFLRILPPVHEGQPGRNYSMSVRDPVTIVANLAAGCDVGQPCAQMTVGFTDRVESTVRIRWTMDAVVYSFTEIPVAMSIDDGP